METVICISKEELGRRAAEKGAALINRAISEKGSATIILATGASQFEMLRKLTATAVDWSRVTVFHLDEYIGLPDTHPASFRGYLKVRFDDVVSPALFHYISGEGDPVKECERLGKLIRAGKVDVAFIGIGENGHLAFNDPPADFDTDEPYIVVMLDEACRRQQLGEGWFPTLEDVPSSAISMSVKQILRSGSVICSVPDKRKATAVRNTLEEPVSPMVPASILREHERTWLFLDRDSASLLGGA